MVVAVRLVNGAHVVCRVDDDAHLPSLPDEPVVEPCAPDRERRDVTEQLCGEDEPVHGSGAARLTVLQRLADDEEALRMLRDRSGCAEQVGAENDVRIDVATQRKAGGVVGKRERRVEPRCAVRGRLEAGHVLDVQLACGLRHVAEQEHLDPERAPALDGSALHCAGLAFERLRDGKKGQHSSA